MCEIMDNIRNKGRLEGLAEGKMKTLVQLLKQKLGSLTPELEIKIQTSTYDQLEQLTIHIFDVKNEEDIMKVLSC